jgi:uncharacterized protein YbjT (DUF2867 family)
MRIFLAGATGATGRVFVPLATDAGLDLVFHVRPQSALRSPLGADPRARVFDLGDAAARKGALAGCDAALSFVGTMRQRFDAGDTYESSDVLSTQHIVDGAKDAGVPRVVLLSSYGAGGMGAYLQMKARCEAIVRESGLRWTVVRPSALVTPEGGPEGSHGARHVPAAAGLVFSLMRHVPGLGGFTDDVRPIPLDVLGRAFVTILAETSARFDGAVVLGRDLWSLGGTS